MPVTGSKGSVRALTHSLARALALALVLAVPSGAQVRAIGRQDAIDAALASGARLAVAAADTSLGAGLVRSAGAFPNPALALTYTKDLPQYHFEWEVPLDYPWQRGTRVRAAEAVRSSLMYRFRFERAGATLDADTLYTLVQAATARLELSRRNALDADSLLRIAMARRDAGDASDLDVEVARLFAGAQRNLAAADSLVALDVTLTLQAAMGLPADAVRVASADSLVAPDEGAPIATPGEALTVAAAQAVLQAAEAVASLERRSRWAAPALIAGVETHDPGGEGNTLLPVLGFTLPVPLFNRNSGPIAVADAERDRARAELALARRESEADIARVLRERTAAMARVARDRELVASAQRVATMSFTAYQEGAAPLASVLEAQRSAREILAQSIDDIARARIADALARVVTLSTGKDMPQ